jgi:uncharacterized protein DUF3310
MTEPCMLCKSPIFVSGSGLPVCLACRKKVAPPSDPVNPPSDPVNPAHYNGDDVMRIIERYELDFLDGQVIKYILRAGRKDGASDLDDHKKAAWYLNRKIGNMEAACPTRTP